MFRPFDAFRRKAVGEPLGACGRNLHGRVLRNRRQGQTVGGRKHLCYAGIRIVLDLLCAFEHLFGNSDHRLSDDGLCLHPLCGFHLPDWLTCGIQPLHGSCKLSVCVCMGNGRSGIFNTFCISHAASGTVGSRSYRMRYRSRCIACIQQI